VCEVDRRGDVDHDLRVLASRIELGEVPVRAEACVVDEHFDPLIGGELDHFADARGLAEVRGQCCDLNQVLGTQLLGDRVKPLPRPCYEDEVTTAGGDLAGELDAEA
jgi:hypothetical protein